VAVSEDPKVESLEFSVDVGHRAGQLCDPAPALGHAVTAGFEFDVPVRFDTDRIQVSVASFQAGEVPSCRWWRSGNDAGGSAGDILRRHDHGLPAVDGHTQGRAWCWASPIMIAIWSWTAWSAAQVRA
jgi:hypothetical protein